MTNKSLARPTPNTLTQAGEAANQVAAQYVFEEYRARRSANTLRGQDADLELFSAFLHHVGVPVEQHFASEPTAWEGVTWGLVEAFVKTMHNDGRALGSINRALSTIKVYASLAMKSGYLSTEAYTLIRTVKGFSQKEKPKVDQKRTAAGIPTRVMVNGKARKKADYIVLDSDQVEALKHTYPATAQGRVLRLMMCLFLDHGLRCSEIAALEVSNFDRKRGIFTFYRQKTNEWETHRMTKDTREALKAYEETGDMPAVGKLLRKTNRDGTLGTPGISIRGVTKWVNKLGKLMIDIPDLSAHDNRHTWATRAAEAGTDTLALMQGGGWTSPSMPARYVKRAKVRNQGVKLE